jgi:hypothetical protein
MANPNEPVLLELAHLPREQVGPFLLLGLDKDASREEIETCWAERVKWARKQQTNVTLEEINWARELLGDPARRMAADATTLTVDTTDGTLTGLLRRHGVGADRKGRASWEPIDEEKQLADYALSVEVPDIGGLRDGIVVPEVPRELPAAAALLRELASETLDPWSVRL